MIRREEAYLHARVSVMRERLLKPGQIETLLERDEAAARALGPLSTESKASFEQQSISTLLEEFLVLVRPLTGTARAFLLTWAHRLELTNLKAILRGKLAGLPQPAIRADLVDMGPFATLPVDDLLRTEDFLELLRRLETTPYADIARHARAVFETEHELFAVDAAVDRRYFASLVTVYQRLDGSERDALRALLGSVLDRVNLVWLLRYRFVYDLPATQTFYLLVAAPFRLDGARLARLCKLESFEDVLGALPAPLEHTLAGARDIFDVTRRLESATVDTAHRVLKHADSALARALAYLVAREFDLRKLRALTKARLLHLDRGITRRALGLEGTA